VEEIWRDVPGYEGLYQVSDHGNVRSLNWRNLGHARNLYLKEHNRGYRHVELRKNGKAKAFTVHRLVAMAFIPNPNNYPVINHKDENKANNAADNLEWCNMSQNMKHTISLHQDRYHVEGKPFYRTEKVIQMSQTGEQLKVWDNLITIKRETGWSQWSIDQCCRGIRKTAYGYTWRFAS
jgi:hypothetical protein